jgi:hypothetical protein
MAAVTYFTLTSPRWKDKGMTEPAESEGQKADCPPWCEGQHDPVDGEGFGDSLGGPRALQVCNR